MLNKIAEFILEKRIKEMEDRIKVLEGRFKHHNSPSLKTPNQNNLIRFESTISFETLNGVKIIEQKIGSKSEPDWAVKETLKLIIPLAKDSGMTKQDFVNLIDKY